MKRIKIETTEGTLWCHADRVLSVRSLNKNAFVYIGHIPWKLKGETARQFLARLEKHEKAQQLKLSACIGRFKTTALGPAKKKKKAKKSRDRNPMKYERVKK